MKLLITGASTLLGSQVLSWFKQNYPEMQISTLDDLSDVRMVKKFLQTTNFDALIHLAAAEHSDMKGTKTLLDAANACWKDNHLMKRFFYVSAEGAAANNLLLKKYKEMTLVISSCMDGFASSEFPKEFSAVAERNLKNSNGVPVYAEGQDVSAWFWVSSKACAIDVIFHQGEAGLVYNIGGMNAWKNAELEIERPMQGLGYAQESAWVKSYQRFMVKVKRIFSTFAIDLNV
jgi:dTDP-glucose 4,6-dehydratase